MSAEALGDLDLDSLTYDDRGLIPVVVQDVGSAAILMVAWANREALEKTHETGRAHFWSRSRKSLWMKGETSGNTLRVVDVRADCDRDTLIVWAHPKGPACHKGTRTCFEPNPSVFELGWLWQVLQERVAAPPDKSYTARLLQKGLPRIAQKVGEEAVETVIASLAEPSPEADAELAGEAADLLYHLLVLLLARGMTPEHLAEELKRRHAARGGGA